MTIDSEDKEKLSRALTASEEKTHEELYKIAYLLQEMMKKLAPRVDIFFILKPEHGHPHAALSVFGTNMTCKACLRNCLLDALDTVPEHIKHDKEQEEQHKERLPNASNKLH